MVKNVIEQIENEISKINIGLPFSNMRLVGRFLTKEKTERLLFYKKWIELDECIFPYKNTKEEILYDDEKEIFYQVVVKVIENKTYDKRERVYLEYLEECLINHKNNLKLNTVNDIFNYFNNPTSN